MKLPARPRVLFISEPSTGDSVEYIFGKFHLGFERLGCPLAMLDPYTTTPEVYRAAVNRFKPDIIFGMLRCTETVRIVSRLLAEYQPVVALNWFQEDPNNVTAEMVQCSSKFSYWFTQDARMVPFWRTKAFYSPHAFDEEVYDDQRQPRIYDVSYIGNLGNPRCKAMLWPYMEALSMLGNKALLCTERPMGPPLMHLQIERFLRWKYIRPFLQALPIWRCGWGTARNERERASVANRSKIHFGLSRVRGDWEEGLKELLPEYPLDKHGLFYQCKGRLFHAVGTGAMALNDYYPELEAMFEIGKEIVTFEFGNLEEMKDKLAYYLKHDVERERIARAGYERGRKQHTFTARIQQILETLRQDSAK
jgi:hypothetical protein